MAPIIMDGRATAAAIKNELRGDVAELTEAGHQPGLGTVLVGSDPASEIYVRGKHQDCADIGINSIRVDLPESATTDEVLRAVRALNEDPTCTGFIVQLPLPMHVDKNAVIEAIDPAKDVDGLHPFNLGRFVSRATGDAEAPRPCTPAGIIELGRRWGVDWDGANVCIVGQGQTVGRPLTMLASREDVNATVDGCHIGTRDLAEHTRRADIVVVATGVAHLLTADMIKEGAAVFDVGVTRRVDPVTGKSKIFGDVAPDVRAKAGWYAPNPGGVGPMTRAMLLVNVVESERRAHARSNG